LQGAGGVARPRRQERPEDPRDAARKPRLPLAEAEPRRAQEPGGELGDHRVVMSASAPAARLRERPFSLLQRAAGRPAAMRGKLARLGSVVGRALDGHTLDERLAELERRGVAERRPTKLQLFLGGVDMLRFWIVPAAADYYGKQGIDFRFHQLLRF